MHAAHPDWLNSEPTPPLRHGTAGTGHAASVAGAATAAQSGAGRVRLLVGLYTAMGLALLACGARHCLAAEATPEAVHGSFLFLGLIGGQVGSCLLWAPCGRLGQLYQHALAWSATLLSAGLLCHWLGGSFERWWLALVILALGAKAADWALRQPLIGQTAARSHRPGAFGLATWISFSLWVAVLLRLLPSVVQQPTETAWMLAIGGGMSLWVAIHRFAFRQLLTPSDPYWQQQRHPRAGRVLDAIGILLIVSLFHALLGAGLWQLYAGQPLGLWLGLVCGTTALWQAIDVQFEAIVTANSDRTELPPAIHATGRLVAVRRRFG